MPEKIPDFFEVFRKILHVGLPACLGLAVLAILTVPVSVMAADSDDAQIEALVERATLYWEARTAEDPITMYDFEAGSVRGKLSLRDYVRSGGGIAYKSAVIKDVQQVDDDEAMVVVGITYQVRVLGGDFLEKDVQSRWSLIDGLWYHDPE